MHPAQEPRRAGGIVLGNAGDIALVKSANSKSWLFPKGKLEPGETDEKCARREILEETGLANLELIDDLGAFTRPPSVVHGKERGERVIKMFLFAAPRGAVPASSREIEEARWVPFREVSSVLGTPHSEWFAADRAWFSTVSERVRKAIQCD